LIVRRAANPLLVLALFCLLPFGANSFAQTQTTGRIAGTVKDQTGAIIVRADVIVISRMTREERRTQTNVDGNYAISLLPAGVYQLSITAGGFKKIVFDNVVVAITETTQVNADLILGSLIEASVTISNAPTLAQADGPRLGRVVDSHAVAELPLATRNFTQILGLSPGADTALADNTGVGRNSQNISVNGARRTQNNFQINGVDANTIGTNSALMCARDSIDFDLLVFERSKIAEAVSNTNSKPASTSPTTFHNGIRFCRPLAANCDASRA